MNGDADKLFYRNRRILKAGFVIMGAILAFSLFFIHYGRLKEPVFFYHYYEAELPMNEQSYNGAFTVYYLSNRTDTRKVTGIAFREAPDVLFYASEDNFDGSMVFFHGGVDQTGEIYGGYALHSVYVRIPYDSNTASMDGIQLSEATFDFTDGSKFRADVGRICLYQPDFSETGLNAFSTSSSSDGISSTSFKVKSGLSLVKLDSPLMDKTDRLFDIKVDGYKNGDLKGREYGMGSSLAVTGSFKAPADVIERLSFYDLKPEIYFEGADGKIYSERIYNFNYNTINRDFTQWEILRYLRARGIL